MSYRKLGGGDGVDFLTSIPKPDDVVLNYLSDVFGPAALIVILYKLYLIAKAWFDLSVAATSSAATFRDSCRRFVAAGLASAGGVVLALAGVGLMLIAWVALSYTMGNGASYLVFDDIPLSGPQLEPFLSWRRQDWVSQFVFQGSIVLAVMATILGVSGKSAEWLAWILILPWCLFILVTGALATFYGIGATYNWFSGEGFAVDVYGVRVNPIPYSLLQPMDTPALLS